MTTRPAAPAAPVAPPAPQKQQQGKSPRMTISPIVTLGDISSGVEKGADRIVICGTGGIGKSTMAAFLPAPLFFDLDKGTRRLNVARTTAATWPILRGKLAAFAQKPTPGVQSVVIDTGGDAEKMATDFVIETRKTEKGKEVDSIEGFGWGKGWQFVFDEFCGLLADLDRIQALGIHVCIITHCVATPIPNPGGEDWLQWQPLLYAGDKKGRGSIRDLVKAWCDHMVFVDYDVAVTEGRGTGSGTRSIHTYETPVHMAKTRSKALDMPYEQNDPGAIWRELGILSS